MDCMDMNLNEDAKNGILKRSDSKNMLTYDQILPNLEFSSGEWNFTPQRRIDFDKISMKSNRSFVINAKNSKYVKGGLQAKIQLKSGLRKQDVEKLETLSKNAEGNMNESIIDRILATESVVSKSIRSRIPTQTDNNNQQNVQGVQGQGASMFQEPSFREKALS